MPNNLKLNPESIKEKSSSYSSLTDLYNIEIFTNKFINTIEKCQIEEKNKIDKIYNNLFIIDDLSVKKMEEQDLVEKLFIIKTENTIIENYKTKQTDIINYYGITCIAIIILFISLFTKRYSKKRGK